MNKDSIMNNRKTDTSMKQIISILLMLSLIGCGNSYCPTSFNESDMPAPVIYWYNWQNPIPFPETGYGGDGHWGNTIRNHVLKASPWVANEGFVSLAPFTREESYSKLILNYPISVNNNPIFRFTLQTCGENVTGLLKINAWTGSEFTTPKVVDLSTLPNGCIEYTLPSVWQVINISVHSDSNGYTPEMRISNTVIQ